MIQVLEYLKMTLIMGYLFATKNNFVHDRKYDVGNEPNSQFFVWTT